MGFLSSLGVPENLFGNFSFSSILAWGGLIILFFLILIVAGVITFFRYSAKLKEKQFKNKIPIFLRISGKLYRIDLDTAKEVFVPDSNISLFFLKKHKIYIARPTRSMAKDEYWYYISENGEWVNFDITSIENQDTLTETNYDHRDTRYSYVNLKEIIKKNYKDKSISWWKDPVVMNIIAFIIMSIIFLGGVWFIVARLGNSISELGPYTQQLAESSKNIADAVKISQNINSGVIPG